MDPCQSNSGVQARCCPCGCVHESASEVDRRGFLELAALGATALGAVSWSALSVAAESDLLAPRRRATLRVLPVLVYGIYQKRPQTSWRSWGGIQTQEDVNQETARIKTELAQLQGEADFPLEFLPLQSVRDAKEILTRPEFASADVLLVYAAGGNLNALAGVDKHTVIFLRHKSGPVYLWYEIVSPRFLRKHTDDQALPNIDPDDVVVDRTDEVLWRLRALGGLKNTVGSKILAVGGAGAWAQPKGVVPELVRQRWKMQMVDVPYADLGKLIQAARADHSAVASAVRRCDAYLAAGGVKLETERQFVANAFLLDAVFRRLMEQAECRAITINSCMSTIMPMAETTACMTLSTLNDDGYLAFCESDFVVIPSGVLLASIAGRPMFLNDPTFPHDGIVTLAHCTAPRKMDGKTNEPVRVLTHFESDYGAAPKVEMRKGQKVTNIIPDFAAKRWVGFAGEIVDAPFLPICRSQIDVKFTCDSRKLAERMPGFHWMTIYGDYLRETGYALKKIPIAWEVLS